MNELILKNSKFGKSVFANKGFENKDRIIEFKGKILTSKEIPRIIAPEDDRYVQIGTNKYLGPSGDFDDFINHSCNPNSGLKIIDDDVILFAIKKIKIGEEITWDYSTTMDEDDWEMDCECGFKKCRKVIRDFKYLPKDLQKKYIKLGIVPKYILRKISFN